MHWKSISAPTSIFAILLSVLSLVALTGLHGYSAPVGTPQVTARRSLDPAAGVAILPPGVVRQAVTLYSVQDLETLVGGSTYAQAVNPSGIVTGSSQAGLYNVYERAFQWQDGWLVALPGLGGKPDLSLAYSINTAPGPARQPRPIPSFEFYPS